MSRASHPTHVEVLSVGASTWECAWECVGERVVEDTLVSEQSVGEGSEGEIEGRECGLVKGLFNIRCQIVLMWRRELGVRGNGGTDGLGEEG